MAKKILGYKHFYIKKEKSNWISQLFLIKLRRYASHCVEWESISAANSPPLSRPGHQMK